ncbi:hypothetical protein [Acinetobacter sp. YH12140]|uniref:hypothetical protein n=1 Tax=Acinetobacter sp. YH12140 TaxID=2601124 RepID=UPI0015D37E4B|nr:hypothetical protein [Acinetobacter sp. YH12140]
MLSNSQKNYIIGLISLVVLIVLALFVYKNLKVEDKTTVAQPQPSVEQNKLVAGLNKEQYISKWCEANSQDPFVCVTAIQDCKNDIKSSKCDSESFNQLESSWNQNKNPDPNSEKPQSKVDQKVLAEYCSYTVDTKTCIKDMNACFDGTSTDKNCKAYIRAFNDETTNGTDYGSDTSNSNPTLEDIYQNNVAVESVKACKGNANCNTFHALAKNWEAIPQSETKQLARDGDGYGLWKGYSYSDERINELAEAGEAAFYRGGAASPKEERIFGQGLAVLLYLQGPENFEY